MNTNFAANALDDAIALQNIREYCEKMLSDRQVYGVSSDHEAGYLAGQEAACQSILDIINGEYL